MCRTRSIGCIDGFAPFIILVTCSREMPGSPARMMFFLAGWCEAFVPYPCVCRASVRHPLLAAAAGAGGAAAESTGHAAEIAASGAQMADAAMHFAGSVARAAGDVAWMLIPVGVVLGAVCCGGYYYCWGQGAVGVPYGHADGLGRQGSSSNGDDDSSLEEEDERWFRQRDQALGGLRSPHSEPDPENEYRPTDEELADWAASRLRAEEEESGHRTGTSWAEDELEGLQRYASDPSAPAYLRAAVLGGRSYGTFHDSIDYSSLRVDGLRAELMGRGGTHWTTRQQMIGEVDLRVRSARFVAETQGAGMEPAPIPRAAQRARTVGVQADLLDYERMLVTSLAGECRRRGLVPGRGSAYSLAAVQADITAREFNVARD